MNYKTCWIIVYQFDEKRIHAIDKLTEKEKELILLPQYMLCTSERERLTKMQRLSLSGYLYKVNEVAIPIL